MTSATESATDQDGATRHCPACREEYEAGVERCANCGGALADGPVPGDATGFDPLAHPLAGATPGVPLTTIASGLDERQAHALQGALLAGGVPAMLNGFEGRVYGAQAILMVPISGSVLVPTDRIEDARAVIEAQQEGLGELPERAFRAPADQAGAPEGPASSAAGAAESNATTARRGLVLLGIFVGVIALLVPILRQLASSSRQAESDGPRVVEGIGPAGGTYAGLILGILVGLLLAALTLGFWRRRRAED